MVRVSQLAKEYKLNNLDLIKIARENGIELQDATSAIRRSEIKTLKIILDKRFGIEAEKKKEVKKAEEHKVQEEQKKQTIKELDTDSEEQTIEGIDLTKIVEETDLTSSKIIKNLKKRIPEEVSKITGKEEKKSAPSDKKKDGKLIPPGKADFETAKKIPGKRISISKKTHDKLQLEEAQKVKEREEKVRKTEYKEKKTKKYQKQYYLEDEPDIRNLIAGTKIVKPVQNPMSSKSSTIKDKSEKKVGTLPPKKRVLKFTEGMTAQQIATELQINVGEVIRKCVDMGEMINANQNVPKELAEIIAGEIHAEFEIEKPKHEEYEEKLQIFLQKPSKQEDRVVRPPVITIMGHVDHGKTKLLDKIRKTDVARQEYGGITQHIGASVVQLENEKKITFIDTPGHEDFTQMRARGAQVTDIAVLVVAADDGVKPQTEEAIDHIKAAGVKMIVAINKIDLPGASPERIRQQLMQKNIIPDNLGGDTAFCEVSAITGQGIEEFLELLSLEAEILELYADPGKTAFGYVIEAEHSDKTGISATILVKDGSLKTSNFFICGTVFSKVKRILNDKEEVTRQVHPGEVGKVYGFEQMPEVGSSFIVHPDDKFLKELSALRKSEHKIKTLTQSRHISLEDLYEKMESDSQTQIDIIIKSDTQGTGQGILKALEELPSEKVRLNIIRNAVGAITEGDIDLADANDAIILGFNVRASSSVKQFADKLGVSIKIYRSIFDVKDDIIKAMEGKLEPSYEEKILGEAEIRRVFKITRVGTIAGCMVMNGKIKRNVPARIYRDQQVIYEGKIGGLKREKEDVSQVEKGYECGINLENFNDIKVGDIIEAYEKVKVTSTL